MGESVGLNFFKFDVIFPYNATDVMNTLFELEHRLKYDTNLAKIDSVEYIEKHKGGNTQLMASSVTKEIYKLVWPFAPRDFIVSSSGIYDTTSKTYYIGKKSCLSAKAGDPEKVSLVVLVRNYSELLKNYDL